MSEDDYRAIADAVMETGRGRWFMAEFGRRNRNADTEAVLAALSRLEGGLPAQASHPDAERIRFDIADMAAAIARAKQEIQALQPENDTGRILNATSELDAIVKSTEMATGDILAAAEHLQEVAWTLREAGVQGAACDIINQRATDIYTACSFQDITGQRTKKVIDVLRYLEGRLNAMMAIWGVDNTAASAPVLRGSDNPLLNGPALPGEGLEQDDIDAMLDLYAGPADGSMFEAPPRPADAPATAPMPEATVREPPARAPGAAGPAISPFTPPVRPQPKPAPEPAVAAPASADARRMAGEAGGLARADMAAPASEPERQDRPAPAARRRPAGPVALADIEALPFEERTALFS